MAGDIVAVLTRDGRLAAISRPGLALLGLPEDRVLGRDWLELAVLPEDRTAVRRDLERLLAGNGDGRGGLCDHRLATAAGTRRLTWTAAALPTDDASGPLAVACGRDVTDQLATVEVLRQNEAVYRRIFNDANDAILLHDVTTGRFIQASARAASLYGYDLETFKGLSPTDLSAGEPPYGAEQAQAHFRLALGGQPQLFEWQAKDKAGRLFWTEVNLRRGAFDGQDRIIAVVRDISERKAAEQALRESEKKFRQLAEALDEVFWLGSVDWKEIYYISPAYERLWGRTAQSLYQAPMSWLDAVHRDDRAMVLDRLTSLADRLFTGVKFPEYRVVRPDGSVRWVQSRLFPVADDAGRPYRAAGIVEDVTDRHTARQDLERLTERLEDMVRERTRTLNRMNEELIREVAERREAETAMAAAKETAEAASQAKSAFLANMSHEIRTPLNGILGMAQILTGTSLDDVQKGFLQDIETSASALLTIINDILDFSKIEADRLELVQEPFGLRGLLGSVEATLGVLAREKGLGLSTDVAEDVPDLLLGDADRLRQVLVNLVGNAIKFTERGGVVIGVQCVETCLPVEPKASPVRQELFFAVSDTGIGIAAKDAARIFDPFTQADGSYTRRFGGTGLGLAITKRLVALMGGVIDLESAPGEGSVFSFTADFGLETPPADPRRQPATAAPPPLPPLRVLLADDNRVSRDIIEKWLMRRGHRVIAVADGRQALEAMAHAPHAAFDLVLMDIKMPTVNGLEAARTIRALPDPDRAGVFMAAVTAHAMPGDRERFLAAGFNDYLAKPVAQEALDRVLTAAAKRGTPLKLPAGEPANR
jgi:PAS domain S-box-containing protein